MTNRRTPTAPTTRRRAAGPMTTRMTRTLNSRDEDEDDGLGGSDNDDEEEEEGAVKTGKSRKRNVFIDDAAEVSSRPEPTRVIPLAAVQFQRRVNIAAA